MFFSQDDKLSLCMALIQSDSALPLHGHRLPEEESVQTDGGTGWTSWDRLCGREHPHPAGQGQKYGNYSQSKQNNM